MYKRLPYLALAVLSLAFALPLRASPPENILATWDYDAAKNVTIHLTNTSGRDITFFEILVTVKHPDGSIDSLHKGTEFLTRMASAAVFHWSENGAFAPGATYDVPATEAQNVQDISIVVEVTAYADGTAEHNNSFMFHHFVADRQGMLLATQRAKDVLKSGGNQRRWREAT